MNRISTRQHLVPGLVDLSEDELSSKPALDPWVFFTAAVVAIGTALLVFTFLR